MLLSNVNRRKAGRFVPVVLAGLILAACSSQGPQAPAVNVGGPATGTSAYYLQQMQQSSDDSKTDWQLLAIRALMTEGKYSAAGKQLQLLPQQVSATRQQELDLLKAQYAVSANHSVAALQLLKGVNVAGLSADQKTRYYATTIAASRDQPSLDTLRAYIALQPLLKGDAQQQNIDNTWLSLRKIPQQQASNFIINANENILQGWLDLLGVYYRSNGDLNALKSGVKDWQTRYPDNPAAKQLPAGLLQSMNMTPASTNTIALLLPLSGPAAVFSQAIEKGFDDARNGVISQVTASAVVPSSTPAAAAVTGATAPAASTVTGSANAPISATSPANTDAVVSPSAATIPAATPPASAAVTAAASSAPTIPATAPANSTTLVKVYDTNTQPVEQLIKQAQSDGATLVVGPLLKDDVSKVASLSTPLNILALNEPGSLQNHPNMCYFALSPENEARDAARHIWQQNKRMPLLLIPANNFGNRVANAFALEWQKLGGSVVEQQTFGSVADLKQRINSNSGIAMTGTPVVVQNNSAPASSSVSVAGLTFAAPEQPAPVADNAAPGNIDSVYIVASQSELALIKPMITMRTGSRSNIALYASSLSSQAGSGPDFRLEMDGLQFSDIPLLSGANPALMQQTVKNFSNDYSLARLYAMGIDAWTLANHFSQLRQQPGYQISGDTGMLNAGQNCVINRTLSWNQYSQGQIIPVH
ncbi:MULTISPECIES: penicillin-binding protein activator [Tatumella]|uniref:Penicillin-binding protein activator LpoA n=1 Tax=Tatumella punctata TaxID=399969 RepID=A0ABW1VM81_9GAMM|nr:MULTISPECIES: penicillin-binding protein activator [unclassified Tatumella]MBS0855209.1 penicillin-binding protein activator [Tatumella sp. JGM16]MBS0876761.1 penicillin-binding protein activator [Tatumella sp. JGM82]MBS0889814.1 penicillin-binding protein activator [Tatumella sp. JGM94]MBS0892892.1 penicillin-binding protein activator [Tatumella sp. JGM130]MBS0901516.1 penicillin-binding protein activator [Tatumella sp. JGM100]